MTVHCGRASEHHGTLTPWFKIMPIKKMNYKQNIRHKKLNMSMSGISNDWKNCLNIICYLYRLALNHSYGALFKLCFVFRVFCRLNLLMYLRISCN